MERDSKSPRRTARARLVTFQARAKERRRLEPSHELLTGRCIAVCAAL